MKHFIVMTTAALTLSACSGETHTPTDVGASVSGVEISNARIRPPLPGQKIAAGYFTLESAAGDKLLAITSSASTRVELHNHIDDEGVMRMRRVDGGIDIPAGGQVEFKPGSYHVMLFDAQITEQSEDIALTFDFETAEDVTIIADVMGADSYGSAASHGSGEAKGEGHSDDDKKSYGSGH